MDKVYTRMREYVLRHATGDADKHAATGGAPHGTIHGTIRPKPGTPAPTAPRLIQNNTSFQVRVTAKLVALHASFLELRRNGAAHDAKWAMLKFYQYLVRSYVCDPEFGVGRDGNARGILAYWTMGMGKTILAVAVALSMMDSASARQPVVVLPRSLQKNIKGAIEWVLKRMHPALDDAAFAALLAATVAKFQFVSMDAYNMADQVSRVGQVKPKKKKHGEVADTAWTLGSDAPGSLDGKLIIVDEAHNFFRAIINSGSAQTNARRLYEMIMAAKDLRIVFLSGTPASKNPFEIVPCFNMIAGRDLLPPVYDTFARLYIDKEKGVMKNRGKLANRLMGMVSYTTPMLPTFPAATSADGAATDATEKVKKPRDAGGFPEKFPLIVERVPMAPDQYRQYLLAREREEAEGKGRGGPGAARAEPLTGPALTLPGAEKKAMSTYYVKSRGLSNFATPREWAGKPVASMPASVFTAETSPKMALATKRILTSPGPALVYSQFVDVGGLAVMARFLQNAGYAPVDLRLGAVPQSDKKHTETLDGAATGASAAAAPNITEHKGAKDEKETRTDKVKENRDGRDTDTTHVNTQIDGMTRAPGAESFRAPVPLRGARNDSPGLVTTPADVSNTRGGRADPLDETKEWRELVRGLSQSEAAMYADEVRAHEVRAHMRNAAFRADPRAYCARLSALGSAGARLAKFLLSTTLETGVTGGAAKGVPGGAEGLAAVGAQPRTFARESTMHRRERYYAIISGDVADVDRERIKQIFNSPENAHGELIHAILVSKTGAEGLDLKYVRQIHLLEPYWDMARVDQVVGRGARLASHDALPYAERDVQPYLYVSEPNTDMYASIAPEHREPETIDTVFYVRAMKNYRLNVDCRAILESVAIECVAFGYPGCRRCAPTGAALFGADAAADVRHADPCQAMGAAEVRAQKVTLRPDTSSEGKSTEFFFTVDPAEVYGYKFYEDRVDLGGYAPLDPSDARLGRLADAAATVVTAAA